MPDEDTMPSSDLRATVYALLDGGRVEEARTLLEGRAGAPDVVALRADVEAAAGNPALAAILYRAALELGQDDVLIGLANTLADSGDVSQAREMYTELAERGEWDAHRNLAILLSADDVEAAIHHFEEAIRLGDVHSNVLLGELLEDNDRGLEAESYYRSATAAGSEQGLLALALWHRAHGDPSQAEELLRTAVSRGVSEAYSMLGHLLSSTGRGQEAEQLYEVALAAGVPDVMLNCANLLSERDDPVSLGRAEHLYRAAIEAGDVLAHNNLGNLLADLGRSEEAIEEYERGVAAGDSLATRNLTKLREELKADPLAWTRCESPCRPFPAYRPGTLLHMPKASSG